MPYEIEMELEPEYLRVTARGAASLIDNIDLGKKILLSCGEKGRDKVLVDVRDLGDPTTITEAYELGKEVGPKAIGILKKAALLHGENRLELEKFFQTTMHNRGINLRAFLVESQAVEWLLSDQ